MYKNLATPRVTLRLISHKDAASMHAILNNPLVSQFNDYTTPLRKRDINQFIQNEISGYYEGEVIRFTIKQNTLNKVIGSCGLYKINKEARTAFLGFELDPEFWQQGYMKETLQTLIPKLVMHYELIMLYAEVNKANTASCKLLEGLGFTNNENIWFCSLKNN
jgi:ribosomal-protein-alanine N-acetyltransferase